MLSTYIHTTYIHTAQYTNILVSILTNIATIDKANFFFEEKKIESFNETSFTKKIVILTLDKWMHMVI